MSSSNLYRIALSNLNGADFEKVCQIIVKNKWNSTSLRFPTSHSGGDGGMDAWDEVELKKYAFSIRQEWNTKILEELSKLSKYNSSVSPNKQFTTMIYLTNQDISTKKVNDFKIKHRTDIFSLDLTIYTIEELSNIISDYLLFNDDYKLYDLLDLTALKIVDRKENLYGLPIEDDGFRDNFEKKYTILNSNKYISNLNNYDSLQGMIVNNINNHTHSHYFITADAGMGKSYEIKRTIHSIAMYNKDTSLSNSKVFAFYYDLKTYIEQDIAPWEKEYVLHADQYYVFLDGWDELSFNNQSKLKQIIQSSLNNKPRTYFVISGRTGSFSETDLYSLFPSNHINCYISLPDKEFSFFPKDNILDMRIPFFRNLQQELASDSQANLSIPNLLRQWLIKDLQKYEHKEQKRHNHRTETQYKRILTKIGEFAFSLFEQGKNTFDETMIVDKFPTDEDEIGERIIKNESWISTDPKTDPKTFYFQHKIFQEYLVALYFVTEYPDTIPSPFITGLNNQMIKQQYGNIFFLWLSIIDKKLYRQALKLAKHPENIMLVLSCDFTHISEDERLDVFENIINDLDNINYNFSDIERLSLWINSLSNNEQLKAIDTLYTRVSKGLKKSNTKSAQFLLSVLTKLQNNEMKLHKQAALDILYILFGMYINKTRKIKLELSNINNLLYFIDNTFKIDNEFENYCKDQKLDSSGLLDDFRIFRITEDFVRELGTSKLNYCNEESINEFFEKYSQDLLSVLLLFHKNYPSMVTMGNISSDNEYKNVVTIGESLRESMAIDFFLSSYTKGGNSIPDSVKNFVLDAFCILFEEYRQKGMSHLAYQTLYQDIFSLAHRCFMLGSLSEQQYEKFRQTIVPLLGETSFDWINMIKAIIEKAPSNEQHKWTEDLLQYKDDASLWFVFDQLFFISIDLSDKKYVECLLERLELNKEPSLNQSNPYYIYTSLLDRYYQTFNNEALDDKWKQQYHKIFGDRDRAQTEYNNDKQLLEHKSVKAELEDVNALFDKDIFNRAILHILELKSKYHLKYSDLLLNSISLKLLSFFQSDKKEYELGKILVQEYPNQILCNFLWQHWEGLTKEYFENKFSTLEWDRVRTRCIGKIIGNISFYSIGTIEPISIDDNREIYFKTKDDSSTSSSKNQLIDYIQDIKEAVNSTINLDIYYKYNILIWLKLNREAIDIPVEHLQTYINQPTLSVLSHPMSSSPFMTLEYILGTDKAIIELCKQNILNYTPPDLERHRWDFYLAFLKFKLTKTDSDIDKIVEKIEIIMKDSTSINPENSEILQLEYTSFCKYLELDKDKPLINIDISTLKTLLQKRTTIPSIWAEQIKEQFEKSTNDQEKYKYGLYCAENNNDIVEWLISHWLSGGDIPPDSFFRFEYPNALKYKFLLSNSLYQQLCGLLEYACEFEELSTRRESIYHLSKTWIENSTTSKKQYYILKESVVRIIQKHSEYNWLKTEWLRSIEAAVSKN